VPTVGVAAAGTASPRPLHRATDRSLHSAPAVALAAGGLSVAWALVGNPALWERRVTLLVVGGVAAVVVVSAVLGSSD
jgi:nitrate reductase gamma subunit